MCWEIMMRAGKQVSWKDGIRRTRWVVVRNTYGELRDTTIKTWLQQFPEDVFGPFAWTDKEHRIRDGDIEMEVLFRALDRPDDVKKLLSLEMTGAWINEAREVPKEILDGLTGRVGRYPSVALGGCSWSGIFMDTNPPDDDHWWYRLAEEERPRGWRFWRQPPALVRGNNEWLPNTRAENINHLPGGYDYYLRQIPGKTEEWIKVYILGEYGTIMTGLPVYSEYNDSLHCAPHELEAHENLSLYLGWDFGLTPAVVLGQLTPRGQLRILDELTAESMGIRQFTRDVVKPFLAQKYPKFRVVSVGDPAGSGRAQTDERTCMDELAAAGIATLPARTNELVARREAVAGFLTKMSDGKPSFLLSPSCRMLRRGFLGGYQFERIKVAGERYRDSPAKNAYSHPHDALQYLALEVETGPVASKRQAQTPARVAWR